MTNNDGRNLVLQVDDDLKDWKCFVLRGEKFYGIYVDVHENMKRAVIFAELKEEKRATFWCKKGTKRSNTVTLKMTGDFFLRFLLFFRSSVTVHQNILSSFTLPKVFPNLHEFLLLNTKKIF